MNMPYFSTLYISRPRDLIKFMHVFLSRGFTLKNCEEILPLMLLAVATVNVSEPQKASRNMAYIGYEVIRGILGIRNR